MPLEINQYPITAVKLEDPDLFDQDADDGVGGWESRKVPWSLIKLELQTGLTFYNISNSNLVADSNYTYGLNGSLLSDTWTIKTGGGTPIQQFRGDNSVYIPTGAVGHGGAASSILQYRLGGSHGMAYGIYCDGTYSTAGIRVLSTNAPNKFVASNVGGGHIGYNSQGNTAATANRSAHRAYIIGTNTAANIGFTCEVSGGANNYAIDIVKGDIRLDTVTGVEIGTTTTEKLGFWNTTPITQPTGLTTSDATATDGTIGTADTIINNLRIRVDELEARLSTSGGGVGLFA